MKYSFKFSLYPKFKSETYTATYENDTYRISWRDEQGYKELHYGVSVVEENLASGSWLPIDTE